MENRKIGEIECELLRLRFENAQLREEINRRKPLAGRGISVCDSGNGMVIAASEPDRSAYAGDFTLIGMADGGISGGAAVAVVDMNDGLNSEYAGRIDVRGFGLLRVPRYEHAREPGMIYLAVTIADGELQAVFQFISSGFGGGASLNEDRIFIGEIFEDRLVQGWTSGVRRIDYRWW